jgi:hypothetical protein
VEIENEGHPGHLERNARKGEEVGQRVHLQQGVAAAIVRRRHGDGGKGEERKVLGQIHGEACSLVALNGQTGNPHAVEKLALRRTGLVEGVDVHGPARRDDRLRLASDSRVLLVVGVREHGDRPGFPGFTGRRRHQAATDAMYWSI